MIHILGKANLSMPELYFINLQNLQERIWALQDELNPETPPLTEEEEEAINPYLEED